MPVGINRIPRTWAGSVEETVTASGQMGTIPTTGTLEILLVAPVTGRLRQIFFTSIGALAANDTNYVILSVVNRSQGSNDISLPAGLNDPNTTKLTGGAALVARGSRELGLNADVTKRVVAKGDILTAIVTVNGTLGGTIAGASIQLIFERTN